MKIQTFSILAGSEACNARCPFCVSKMTPSNGVELKEPTVNWRNFRKACLLAKQCGVTTVMFTGKGEPTLFPDQITKFLRAMEEFEFPLIEVQTNGIAIIDKPDIYGEFLKTWYQLGMTTVAVSIVHYDPEKNREVYLPYRNSYINLPKLIDFLHNHGFSVRLICIMANGFIDDAVKLQNLLQFARTNKVEQLTTVLVNKPDKEHSRDTEEWQWTNTHHLTEKQLAEITDYIEKRGAHYMTLPNGARVFDINGQNLCLNACLTVHSEKDDLRNLIFFPDGHLRPYWQYEGALLL